MLTGIAALAAAAIITLSGALSPAKKAPPHPNATTSPPRSFLSPFPKGSIWSSPLAAPVKVDPASAAKIDYWLAHSIPSPSMNLRRYGWAIVEVGPGVPTYSVTCVIYACPGIGRVPIPAGTQPDPGTDGHLVVYDAARALEWDFWISHCPDDCHVAGAGNRLSTAKGNPFSAANASGFPGLAGIVHPEEIIKGRIDHPLVFAMPNVGRGHVCPARNGAGSSTDALALPEGTLMQLDPSIRVAKLPLPRWQKVIARALQRYGMYLEDGSGNLSIGSENPINRGDLWAKAGLLGDYADFAPAFPWAKMRVLAPPAPWCATKARR
ncbi:MAG: hypothetical protein ACXVRJ_07540 [Gaiellaceae bacterium]